jgi:hypothetical protein
LPAFTSQANAGSSGNAGDVTVKVTGGGLEVTDNGRIATSTYTGGDAGKVSVDVAGPLVVANSGADGGITSQANPGSSGNAGTVTVAAGELTLRSDGRISSSSFGSGDAGQINIRTPVVRLRAGSRPSPFQQGAVRFLYRPMT